MTDRPKSSSSKSDRSKNYDRNEAKDYYSELDFEERDSDLLDARPKRRDRHDRITGSDERQTRSSRRHEKEDINYLKLEIKRDERIISELRDESGYQKNTISELRRENDKLKKDKENDRSSLKNIKTTKSFMNYCIRTNKMPAFYF